MRLLAYFFAHGCRKIAKKHPNSHIFVSPGLAIVKLMSTKITTLQHLRKSTSAYRIISHSSIRHPLLLYQIQQRNNHCMGSLQ